MPSSVSEENIPKLSGSLRPQPALDPHRHRGVVHGRSNELRRLRPDQQLQAERAGAEHLAEGAERDDGEVVLRVAEGGSLLLADADDAVVQRADLDHLVERVDRAEQLVGDLPPDDGHRAGSNRLQPG